MEYAKGLLARRRSRAFVAEMMGFAPRVNRRVDVAFNLINTIRHLGSDGVMLAHLRAVRSVLGPGGVYAVGISLTSYGMEFPSEDVWEGRRGRVSVKQVVQYIPPLGRGRRERVYSHLVIRRGDEEEHRDSAYWLRSYSRPQWEAIIRRAGFEIAGVVDERGHHTAPRPCGYGVWVLRPAKRRG